MRSYFDGQLELLNVEMIRMGSLCEDAIAGAARTLQGKQSCAVQVRQAEQEIDQKERDIENLCFRLLLKQQPVAGDLRQVSSALKMVSDMERIGDQASDIAEVARYVKPAIAESHVHINDMAEATGRMVTDSIDSFVRRDLKLARKVMKEDDVVDALFDQVKREIAGFIAQDGENGSFGMDLLMIAKYFERIGDHAVNIAEWVEYSITGNRVDETR